MNAVLRPELSALPDLHADRSEFLGGSDIAAVMGLSPWQTPVELWMEKTGRATREEIDPKRQRMFERGHKLEPFIRDMVIQRLQDEGVEVELLDTNRRYRDSAHPFLACEIDFELRLTGTVEIGGREYLLDGEIVNADAKSVSGFARKKWGMDSNEDVPIEYACQFVHGLGITGRRLCLVAALRSFDDVDVYWTVRDDETVEAIRAKAVQFWTECVLADKAPDPFTFSDIKLLFPSDNGLAVEATAEIAEKVSALRRIRATVADLKQQDEELTFAIGEFISPHSRLTFGGEDICTWKAQSATRLDQSRLKEEAPDLWKKYSVTSSTRVLRLKSLKKES